MSRVVFVLFLLSAAPFAQRSRSVAPASTVPVDATTWYVDDDACPLPGSGTAADPFCSIQVAIDAAADGDVVSVAPGTYLENLSVVSKEILIESQLGPEVTIVDGGGLASVVCLRNAGPGLVLSGFTLQNGSASEGGGIEISGGAPTIRGNVVQDSTCRGGGGGIGIGFASARIEGNVIRNNRQLGGSGGIGGGGIAIRGAAAAQILDNLIEGNQHGSWGGGITCFAAGNPVIRGNVIRDNTAGSGSALNLVNRSDAEISNNLILGNQGGTAIDWLVPSGGRGPFLHNNTIVDNAGASVDSDGFTDRAEIVGNVISVPAGGVGIRCGNFTTQVASIRYNDVWAPAGTAYSGACPNLTGIDGNVSVDPLFLDAAAEDYRLSCDSPCVDAGETLASVPTEDFEGDPRVVDGDAIPGAVVDMGFDEFDFLVVVRAGLSPQGHHPGAGQIVHFEAQSPPSSAGETAFVYLSLGDGSASGGVLLPGASEPLGLDADELFALWLTCPLPLRSTELRAAGVPCPSGVTTSFSVTGLFPEGAEVFYAGSRVGAAGSAEDVSPTHSFLVAPGSPPVRSASARPMKR